MFSRQLHPHVRESEVPAGLVDNLPALLRGHSRCQLSFESGHINLRMQNMPKGPFQHQSARRVEFRVSQVLHADPRCSAKNYNDQPAKPVLRHALEKRKSRGYAAHAVEQERNTARAEAAVEQAVMNMVAVSSKYGLMTQEPPDDGNHSVQKRDPQGHQRRRHAQNRGRFLAPDDPVAAQQEPDRETAAISQKNRSGIEGGPEKSQSRAGQRHGRQGRGRIVLEERGEENCKSRERADARRKTVYSINQIERVGTADQP